MLALTLTMLVMSTAPETGLYLNGQASKAHLETPVLLEELQARLPELRVTTTPTQNQGKFYTLRFSEQSGDKGQTLLLFILQDSNQKNLFKRSLVPSPDSLETARQIALVVEGVIKRRGDALREILKAQKPDPITQPEPVVVAENDTQTNRLQLDALGTVGSMPGAKRPILGSLIGAQVRTWESLYLGFQLGFHQLLESGQSNNGPGPALELRDWNVVATASWLSTWRDLTWVTLVGAGITIAQSSSKAGDQSPTYRAIDVFLTMRASSGISWGILNNFELLALFSADISPSHPKYTLQGEELLNRGSLSIFGSLGCRY